MLPKDIEKLSKDLQLYTLHVEYKTLSALEDHFGKNSKHSAAIYIDNRMRDILNTINQIESNANKRILPDSSAAANEVAR